MKAPRWICRIVFGLLILFADKTIYSQWKNVAPGLIGPVSLFGAMTFQDGTIWAGHNTLWRSTDLGKTWQQLQGYSGGEITVIQFFDRNFGLIGNEGGNIYLSRDGGLTWNPTIFTSMTCRGICFGETKNEIAVTGIDPAVYITTNGGTSWVSTMSVQGDDWGHDIVYEHTRGLIMLASLKSPPTESRLYNSSDFGSTWQRSSNSVDYDAYSISQDSCQDGNIYVMDEDYYSSVDQVSQIYSTADKGNSWVNALAFPVRYFAGSIGTGRATVYAPSVSNGTYRSTNKGSTWTSIGGPDQSPDSRLITVVNDNIVLSCDPSGSIWETTNSGGDSIPFFTGAGAFSISPDILFDHDTIRCNDSLVRSIALTTSGCLPPSLSGWRIIGPDSSSFGVGNFTKDSLRIILKPKTPGDHNALVVLTLNNGISDTITLKGYNILPHQLALATKDQATDTLGGSVNVPITISGLDHAEDIDLVLHYDSKLNYNGSYSITNVKLDLSGDEWSGRSKLHVTQARPDIILGYSRFTVFNDSLTKSQVTFDSISVLTAVSPCQYILPISVTSTITPPSGCGIGIVSHFIHTGEIPQLSLMPNPTTGEVSIISSANLGEANITIYDMLGTQRGTKTLPLVKNTAEKLSLPSANGIYYIRITTAGRTYDLRAVVNH